MNQDWKKNFAIIIPSGPLKTSLQEPDSKGKPIYAGCKSNGPCACTGRCRVIVGYDTRPEVVEDYIKKIDAHNLAMEQYRASLGMAKWTKNEDGTITWELKTNT